MNRRTFPGAIAALAVPMPAVAAPINQMGWYRMGKITFIVPTVYGVITSPVQRASLGWSHGSAIGQLLDPPKDVA